jgi:F-type H+-transporting ATPase subunit b
MTLSFLAVALTAGGGHNVPTTQTPEFWVAVAFVLFMALLAYKGVPALIGKALDDRADAIKKNLDDARKMREDAQTLLTEYQRKSSEAESEAQKIVEQARKEGEALRAEAERKATESVARRVKLAEEKIARAEMQAVSEVRGAAVDAAIQASEKILASKADSDIGQRLISDGISDLKTKLN